MNGKLRTNAKHATFTTLYRDVILHFHLCCSRNRKGGGEMYGKSPNRNMFVALIVNYYCGPREYTNVKSRTRFRCVVVGTYLNVLTPSRITNINCSQYYLNQFLCTRLDQRFRSVCTDNKLKY